MAHPDLSNFLRVLGDRNKERGTQFLLAPHLFHIIHAGKTRQSTLAKMPALGRRPAELRAHFKKASAKATALAHLVRKGPEPQIALAAHRDAWEELMLFQPLPIIQSPNHAETIIPLHSLLKEVVTLFDTIANKIPRAQHHQTVIKSQVVAERRYATTHLVAVFRRKLEHPYHSHVASIVEALTGIATDADYVKKLDRRSNSKSRGQTS